jgi:hypothetical protein
MGRVLGATRPPPVMYEDGNRVGRCGPRSVVVRRGPLRRAFFLALFDEWSLAYG